MIYSLRKDKSSKIPCLCEWKQTDFFSKQRDTNSTYLKKNYQISHYLLLKVQKISKGALKGCWNFPHPFATLRSSLSQNGRGEILPHFGGDVRRTEGGGVKLTNNSLVLPISKTFPSVERHTVQCPECSIGREFFRLAPS